MRRAQSIGINLVIIAAIALLVLVIIGMVVIGGGENLAKGTRGCLTAGGKCMDSTEAYNGDYDILAEYEEECSPRVCAVYTYG